MSMIDREKLKNQMTEWVRDLTRWPHRMTGTKEGLESAEYVQKVFEESGLENVQILEADSLCTDVLKSEFTVEGKKQDCFLSNGTNKKAETGKFLTDIQGAELVYVGDGLNGALDDIDVNDKIVICDVFFIPHFWNETPATRFYSPNGEFEREREIYSVYMPENYIETYYKAMESGAAAYIGVLQNFMDEYFYNEDYSYVIEQEDPMAIPTMWMSKEKGKALTESLPAKADLVVETNSEYKKALTVVGTLEGMTEDITLIQSHHDAAVEGGVQDASGMSVVFALAQYYASLPKEQRRTNMMFLSTDSHYTDYEGHDRFLDLMEEQGKTIAIDFCVEHIAKEMDLGPDNEMIIYDRPETRILYATDVKGLADMAFETFCEHDMAHTMLMPAAPYGSDDYDPDFVCTDAYSMHERGIPLISHLTAPMYLSHNSDTFDKVYFDGLVPTVETYIDMVSKAWDILKY